MHTSYLDAGPLPDVQKLCRLIRQTNKRMLDGLFVAPSSVYSNELNTGFWGPEGPVLPTSWGNVRELAQRSPLPLIQQITTCHS